MMRHCAFNEFIYLFDLDVNSLIARYPDNLSRFFHALTSFFSENLSQESCMQLCQSNLAYRFNKKIKVQLL